MMQSTRLEELSTDAIRQQFISRTRDRDFYLIGVCTNPYLFGDVMTRERDAGHTEEYRRHLASTACIWLGYETAMGIDKYDL
jgi:hypothetical protein